MTEGATHQTQPPAALIVGCGYLGRQLAGLLVQRGQRVYATTRSQSKAPTLAKLGVRPLILTVTQPVTYASLTPALNQPTLDVYYLIPPGRMDGSPNTRQTVLGGAAHMVKALRKANVRRAVYASSSAVYGQTDGRRVDANTPPLPNSPRAELLLQGESLWLDAGSCYRVVRLAGLYGPGRVIGMQALRQGAPIIGNPNALLNLIHVDDAASLLLATAESQTAARTELGCDNGPVPRVDYYNHLAERLDLTQPAILNDVEAAAQYGLNPNRLARSSNKTLDNTATRQRTGWAPVYPDYRAGLDTILQRRHADDPQTLGRT